MLFTQLEQSTSEELPGAVCLCSCLSDTQSTPATLGNSKPMQAPADEIKQMLLILWHLMKQLEVFQETEGVLASSPHTCFWCCGRLGDVQIFMKESVTWCNNRLWRAPKSGHLNVRQRHLALQTTQRGSGMFYRGNRVCNKKKIYRLKF